jgi:RNA polymerase sigma-70 factor (ECF subfamily)
MPEPAVVAHTWCIPWNFSWSQTEYVQDASNQESMSGSPATDRLADEVLVQRTAAGDREAFAALYRRRRPDVFRFAIHMTADSSVAEDVVQDVFMAVMQDAGRFEAGRSAVVAWLCGIARNQLRQRLARDRRLEPLAHDEEWSDWAAAGPQVLTDLLRIERVEAVRRAVLSLPLRYREAVVLCDLQELSYVDAADALSCAIGTVRSRLHRGRSLLASKLSEGPDQSDNRREPAAAGGSRRSTTRGLQPGGAVS